jgi:phasin family protein
MFTSTTPNLKQTFAPFMAYSKLATEATEKAIKLQMDFTKAYAKVGLDNIAEGFKVTNFDQMTSYTEKQKDIFTKTNDMMVADSKSYADIGTEFFESARYLMEDTVKSTMTAVKEATKAAVPAK